MSLNLEVQILGEFKNLTKATKGATKQLQNFQGRVRGISRSINATLATIGVGLSLNALTNGIRSAVSQASNLEESINAVRVSFGPAAESILAIGENSAKAFGLARSEFNSAAVTFSAFTDEIAGPGGDSAKVIEDLTTRAADFASVFNIDVAEALRVFRSGLSGESEPLKRFGIILNDTAVKQFAYNRGIAETGKELTNTQKVQARYALLLEETSKTQGDFANTSGSLANSLRIARASFTEVSASIGSGFAPAIAAVAQFISNNIVVFDNLGKAIGERLKKAFEDTGSSATIFGQKLIGVVEDFTDFLNGTAQADNTFTKLQEKIAPFISLFSAFGDVVLGIIEIIKGLADGLFGWLSIFTGVEGGVENLSLIISGFGKGLQQVGYGIGFVGSLLVPFTGGFKLLGQAMSAVSKIGKGIVDFFTKFVGNPISKFFQGAANRINAATKAGKALDDQLAKTPNTLKALDPAVKKYMDLEDAADATSKAVKATDEAAVGAKNAFDRWDGPLGKARTGLSGVATAATNARNEIDKQRKALDAQDGKRIRNFIDVITTNRVDTGLIPASPTTDNRPGGPLKPGYSESFIGRDDQWYTRTWTGSGWRITKDADAYKTPTTGGGGDTTFQTRVKAIVAKLQETLDEARERIRNASESFRDAVGLSFGVITNGFSARFSVSRVIAQMKRIKDAVKTFSKDIIELRKKGADAALIDELIGLGPLAGSVAARELVTSGSLNEFLSLRKDLTGAGAAVGAAGNLAITGTSTSGLTNAINTLNRTIAAGKGNTYNISIANPNITPQQIIAEIKAYEKKTGKKVFSN